MRREIKAFEDPGAPGPKAYLAVIVKEPAGTRRDFLQICLDIHEPGS